MAKVQEVGIRFGIVNNPIIFFDQSSGWFFVKDNTWFISFRVSGPRRMPIASHCHQDFGAPVVFNKNQEILIDIGRNSYLEKHKNEVFASSHSTFLINGKPTFLSERDFPIIPIINYKFKFKYYQLDGNFNIFIRYPISFLNKSNIQYALRMISFNSSKVIIKDRIKLIKSSEITSNFNFAYPLKGASIYFKSKIDESNFKKLIVDKYSDYLSPSSRSIDYNKIIKSLKFSKTEFVLKTYSSKLSIII